ncbi:alkaline phosphatase family protein, partial [Sphingobacterium sp. IITKGP-BTPF85]|uniref:alkaline phosphatase family protein n=1 Tax=Sphingobacterium sp. IITKGP-BTPF85 TaxID=1338009 RepID=UPI0021CED5DC
LDAEHIVMLMQENRSFDHSFGTLSGVRGYGDPRAIQLPNGNPVWLQSGKDGKTFSPFRLDIKRSKAAWTSYLHTPGRINLLHATRENTIIGSTQNVLTIKILEIYL